MPLKMPYLISKQVLRVLVEFKLLTRQIFAHSVLPPRLLLALKLLHKLLLVLKLLLRLLLAHRVLPRHKTNEKMPQAIDILTFCNS